MGTKTNMSSLLLVTGLIKISQQRISALSARTYVVIPALHWEGRGGLGVNTYRRLSLSLCAGEKQRRRSLYNASLQREPPTHSSYLFSGFGGSLFSHQGNSFFSSYAMDALWPLNENPSFQCAFLRVSVLPEGQ